jgi:hypothetical protein
MKYILVLCLIVITGCDSAQVAIVNRSDCNRLITLARTASDTELVRRSIPSMSDRDGRCGFYLDIKAPK